MRVFKAVVDDELGAILAATFVLHTNLGFFCVLSESNMAGSKGLKKVLLGMGNPLLDISAQVDQAFLDKYKVRNVACRLVTIDCLEWVKVRLVYFLALGRFGVSVWINALIADALGLDVVLDKREACLPGEIHGG